MVVESNWASWTTLHIICISADVGVASMLILALLLVDYFVGGASLFVIGRSGASLTAPYATATTNQVLGVAEVSLPLDEAAPY